MVSMEENRRQVLKLSAGALAILFGAYLVMQATGIGGGFGALNMTGLVLGSKAGQTVAFSAEFKALEKQSISISSSVKLIEINNPSPHQTISVNGLDLRSPQGSKVLIKEYNGKLLLTSRITLDGEAKEFSENDLTTSPSPAGKIRVRTSDLIYDRIKISGIQGASISLKDVSGRVNIEGREESLVIEKKKGNVDLSSFSGEMTLYEDRIILSGSGIFRTETLSTPKD